MIKLYPEKGKTTDKPLFTERPTIKSQVEN